MTPLSIQKLVRPVTLVAIALLAGLLTSVPRADADVDAPRQSSQSSQFDDDAQDGRKVALYDTAWDLPSRATSGEITSYLDHIAKAGFTGVWISFLPLDGWGAELEYGFGMIPASLSQQQEFIFDPAHIERVRLVLDQAHDRGLEVTVAAAWAVGYVHGHWFDGSCQNLNRGPLSASNAEAYGVSVANAIGDHPGLSAWLFGGDNFCNREDVSIWDNMASGIKARGATQPIGYHTPSGGDEHFRFSDRAWHDFFAPQTSHCNPPRFSGPELKAVAKATNKRVIASELRYEAMEPAWSGCNLHGPGDPVTPQDVLNDVRAATKAGVDGIVFGHNERWQWRQTSNGAVGNPIGSLGSGGEALALQYLRNSNLLPGSNAPVLFCGRRRATIMGTDGDDVLIGTGGADVFVGLGGDDKIRGKGGRDIICGGAGDDVLKGGPGNDWIGGGAGADRLIGNSGRDRLIGGIDSDFCNGGRGRDRAHSCEVTKSTP
ncbi:MAG: DUF4038 domain-containing protein [Acidimicrobiales bacterium]